MCIRDSFTGLSNRPNCVLVWNSGVGLGEHTLTLKTTKIVKAGTQLFLNYGPLRKFGAKPRRLVFPKAACKKRGSRKKQSQNLAD